MPESLHDFSQSLDVGYPGSGSLQKSLKYLTAGRHVLTASLNCEAGPSLKKKIYRYLSLGNTTSFSEVMLAEAKKAHILKDNFSSLLVVAKI